MREFLTVFLLAASLYGLATYDRDSSRASAVSLPARTIAPAAGMTPLAVGASYIAPETPDVGEMSGGNEHASVSLAERGGDLQSPAPQQVGHEAPAPAPQLLSGAGAFENKSPDSFHVGAALKDGFRCQCGANCQCRLSKNEPVSLSQPANLKPAPAQPPAPAMPAYAPAYQWAAPATYYQPYRPTFAGYYQSSCGPGGCAPSGGFRLLRRGR